MSNSLDKLKALSSRLEEAGIAIPVLPKRVKKRFKPATIRVIEPSITIVEVLDPTPSKVEIIVDYNDVRENNLEHVRLLYDRLGIYEKSPDYSQIFIYKAMNLSGIGLKDEDFGQIREGKYIQIIAITYEPDKNGKKKAKNISLGYFGKAEILKPVLKDDIIEFVLRWRYEKAFQNVEHYKDLIEKIGR
ncbi:MAG: hypothetical protein Q9M36_06070 [Sulfurovum sp.]|nr:hypothetical protein [Sulfurovum sp.]